MPTRNLTELTTQVRRRADMEGSQLVSDAEVQQYIQDSWGEYWDLLMEAMPEAQFSKSTEPIVTSAGTTEYDLLENGGLVDAQVYKVTRAILAYGGETFLLRPNTNVLPLGAIDASQRGRPTEYTVFGPAYSASGGATTAKRQIAFSPVPDGAYTVHVLYIPSPPNLTTSADVNVYCYAGWDEYIVCDAAAKCLEKEESFQHADRLLMRKAAVEQRIRWHLATLFPDGGGRVRDVDSERVRDFWRHR